MLTFIAGLKLVSYDLVHPDWTYYFAFNGLYLLVLAIFFVFCLSRCNLKCYRYCYKTPWNQVHTIAVVSLSEGFSEHF